MKKLLLVLLSITSFACVSAHGASHGGAQLVTSTPANGSISDAAPSSFVFDFSQGVRLHELFIKKEDGKSNAVGNLPNKDMKTITIPAPSLTAGNYVLDWAVFTHDSRVLRGQVRFTVSAAGAPASASTH